MRADLFQEWAVAPVGRIEEAFPVKDITRPVVQLRCHQEVAIALSPHQTEPVRYPSVQEESCLWGSGQSAVERVPAYLHQGEHEADSGVSDGPVVDFPGRYVRVRPSNSRILSPLHVVRLPTWRQLQH